jgi:hypothetical protein
MCEASVKEIRTSSQELRKANGTQEKAKSEKLLPDF